MSCCRDSIRPRLHIVYFCPFADTVPLDDVLQAFHFAKT